jgi:hypothetical protein
VIPFPFTNWFAERMGRDRFKVLLSHISGDLSFIEKRLQQNFLKYHWPHQWVTLDETIIPYYGKNCPFLVSIPKKSWPTGIKVGILLIVLVTVVVFHYFKEITKVSMTQSKE